MIQVGVIKGREGSAGVAAQSYGSTDWPLEKGQLEAMRGEELPKWLFSLLFLSLSSQGRDSVWLFMSMWVSKRGCRETHQPSLFFVMAWLSLVWVCHTNKHSLTRTLSRTPTKTARTEERTLLRGKFWKLRCTLHKCCQQCDRRDAFATSKCQETSKMGLWLKCKKKVISSREHQSWPLGQTPQLMASFAERSGLLWPSPPITSV